MEHKGRNQSIAIPSLLTASSFNKLQIAIGNISRAMGEGGPVTDSPTFRISMREYEDMAIRVGDKVTVEINKSDRSSGR